MISLIRNPKRVAKGKGGRIFMPFSNATKQQYLPCRRVWGGNKIAKMCSEVGSDWVYKVKGRKRKEKDEFVR